MRMGALWGIAIQVKLMRDFRIVLLALWIF